MNGRNRSEATWKQLARWLRRKFRDNHYAGRVTDDELIEQYFRHAESTRESIAKSAGKGKEDIVLK